LDGVEVAHPVGDDRDRRAYMEFFHRAERLGAAVAPIGSSDFHLGLGPPRGYTCVFADEPRAADVLTAIRRGTTVAVDQDGRLYGDPALVRLAEQAGPPRARGAPPLWAGAR